MGLVRVSQDWFLSLRYYAEWLNSDSLVKQIRRDTPKTPDVGIPQISVIFAIGRNSSSSSSISHLMKRHLVLWRTLWRSLLLRPRMVCYFGVTHFFTLAHLSLHKTSIPLTLLCAKWSFVYFFSLFGRIQCTAIRAINRPYLIFNLL